MSALNSIKDNFVKFSYIISRLILKFFLYSSFRFEIKGRENLPKKGSFILTSNHSSYLDPMVLGVVCDVAPVTFMAKRELFEDPRFGFWYKLVDCIRTDRFSGSGTALRKALKKLKEGKIVGIFPEGTRSTDGSLQKAEPGVGLIAIKSGVPVIPVYISGSTEAWQMWRENKKKAKDCKLVAKIGKAVDITGVSEVTDKRNMYESVGEKIMVAIADLKNG